jgi:hypothetical protein
VVYYMDILGFVDAGRYLFFGGGVSYVHNFLDAGRTFSFFVQCREWLSIRLRLRLRLLFRILPDDSVPIALH